MGITTGVSASASARASSTRAFVTTVPLTFAVKPSAKRTFSLKASSDAGAASSVNVAFQSSAFVTLSMAAETSVETCPAHAPAWVTPLAAVPTRLNPSSVKFS